MVERLGNNRLPTGIQYELPRTKFKGVETEDRVRPLLSTGTGIDTIDFMGDKPDIPGNSLTSGGLSPFGTAFAAAR